MIADIEQNTIKIKFTDGDLIISSKQLALLKSEFNFFAKAFNNQFKEQKCSELSFNFNKRIFSDLCALCFPDENLNEFSLSNELNPREIYSYLDYLESKNIDTRMEAVIDKFSQENFDLLIQLIVENEHSNLGELPKDFTGLASKKIFQLLSEQPKPVNFNFDDSIALIPIDSHGYFKDFVNGVNLHFQGKSSEAFNKLLSFFKETRSWHLLFSKNSLEIKPRWLQQISASSLLGIACAAGLYEKCIELLSILQISESLSNEVVTFIRNQLTENGTIRPDQARLFEQFKNAHKKICHWDNERDDDEMEQYECLSERWPDAPNLINTSYNQKLDEFNAFLIDNFLKSPGNTCLLDCFVGVNANDYLSYKQLATSILSIDDLNEKMNALVHLLKYKTNSDSYKAFINALSYILIDTMSTISPEEYEEFSAFFHMIAPLNLDCEGTLLKVYLRNAKHDGIDLPDQTLQELHIRLEALTKAKKEESFTDQCRQIIDYAQSSYDNQMYAGYDTINLLHCELKVLDPEQAITYLKKRLAELNLTAFAEVCNLSLMLSVIDGMSFETASAVYHSYLCVYALRGYIYLAMGELEEAKFNFDFFIENISFVDMDEKPPVLSALGYIEGLKGKFESALAYFEKTFEWHFRNKHKPDPISFNYFMQTYNQHLQLQLPSSAWHALYTKLQAHWEFDINLDQNIDSFKIGFKR